jgi:DNA-binding transcriptional LysR family regulator
LHHLRDLLAVVETGSLRAAARKLGLTQPSLTKSLRQLEEQTALSLLVRSSHGVTLTNAGQRVVARARAIESEMRRTAEDLELLRGGALHSVSIGVSMATPLEFVARAVASLHQREPNLHVQIFEGVQAKLIAEVRQGVVDFAIIPVAQRDALIDLRTRPLFHTRVVVVGRSGHPRAPAQSLAELASCHWITPRRGGVLDGMVERLAISRHLPAFSRPIQCDSSSLYWDLIASTDLVGLSLATKLEDQRVAGASILFDGAPLPEIAVALIHRADFPQNALAGELAERCREEAAVHVRPRLEPRASAAKPRR